MNSKLPLGRQADYPRKYAPEVLCPIARDEARAPLGIGPELPFRGVDTWNAWELTWLGPGDLPRAAIAEIVVPATSANIVESKSLKLYLNSFSMSRFDTEDAVTEVIAEDLSRATAAPVEVAVTPVAEASGRGIARLPGARLDDLDVTCTDWDINPDLLAADRATIVHEDLHTHLLRSLCPVTAQPDMGSLLISYRGPRIDHAGLLRYIVSFREHQDFHEVCIERMFCDIMERCGTQELSLHARYQRRGGIDINPFRSNVAATTRNLRLWRQ